MCGLVEPVLFGVHLKRILPMLLYRNPRLLAVVALLVSSFIGTVVQAQPSQGYITLSPPRPSDTPAKVEVLEFFSYACGHCARMESLLEVWARTAPPDVVLKRVPVAFNGHMKPMQQLYYTLLALGRSDLHVKVFDAIHAKGLRLFDKKAMATWAASQGVDRAKFDLTFDSFSVQLDVQRANGLAEVYHLDGTPSFVIGGKFVTSPAIAGNSYESAIKKIDTLIPMSRT